MPYLLDQKQKIFFTKKGHGPPPALLLIHGAGGCHLDWPLEIQRLDSTIVYAIDLPGHGRSEGSGRNSIAEYAIDVIQLIDTLSLKQVVVAGYSMGGAVALEIGLRRIQGVIGLVLISTGATLPVGESILNLISTDYPKATDLIVKLSWSRDAPELVTARAKERLLETDQRTTFRDFSACNTFNVREEIVSIEQPTLVISGSADKMAPIQYGRELADLLPNARLVEIEGGPHMVLLEKPTTVAAVIADFLAELRWKEAKG